MRAVVQRVTSARVTVEQEAVGEIGTGLLVLVGVTHHDTSKQAATLARKVHELRIFGGDLSVADLDAAILVVSQFTLYADTRKGRRPSWVDAAPALMAEPLVDEVVARLRQRGARVQTGRFGAHMSVELVGDGPVTIILDVDPPS
jgi:D-tyrosyl-tRNA(Tyr) deacylase